MIEYQIEGCKNLVCMSKSTHLLNHLTNFRAENNYLSTNS